MKQVLLKQIVLFIAIAAVVSVAVVGFTKNSNSKKVDATELAQFEAWKTSSLQKELEKESAMVIKPVTKSSTAKRAVSYQSPKMVSESQNAAKTTTVRKKGWSKAAKGTAIGAGAGAVLGAVINKKNRAVGAVIGGVIGGGGGYVIGRGMDKKDGRY
ncbi:MAG TPA: glycine zipper domain-containing protein [Chitinophagaceae bacterium]|nr:glycine zipper domain-containing protein [Chitinophagaceae bacterium]